MVEALKASWTDRRKAVANTGAARQKALEASNTFTDQEGTSRRMIYHALDHFTIMAPPTPALSAPVNMDVIGLLILPYGQLLYVSP